MLKVPVLSEVDLVVLGGTSGAVSAALAARQAGARVFCVTPYTYLGEDICAHLAYWPQERPAETATLAGKLFASLFPEDKAAPSPLSIKHQLDIALLGAEVDVRFLSFPVATLRAPDGAVGGLIIGNRSGFQAIRAKAICDASERALAARLGGAAFHPFVAGTYRAERTVAGALPEITDGLSSTACPTPLTCGENELPAWRIGKDVAVAEASQAAFAQAETELRLATWHPDQLVSSDRILLSLPDRLETGSPQQGAVDPASVNDEAFQAGHPSLLVLGPMADLDDAGAASLREPARLMALGERLGAALGSWAIKADRPAAAVPTGGPDAGDGLDMRREDTYFRLEDREAIDLDLNALPRLSPVDVVVAGGGTGGAPAGIAAGRQGARTVVIEPCPSLGGVANEGRIASYYHGNRIGFTAEIDLGVQAMGPNPPFPDGSNRWNTEWKKHWYLRESAAASTAVWFQSMTLAAATRNGAVAGVLAATPYGVGVIEAKAVVDGTGSADVVAAAGGQTVTLGREHVAVQGTGLSPFDPGKHYTNTDYSFIDDNDVLDTTRAFMMARAKFPNSFDMAQIVNSRERRQIVGAFTLDPLHFLAGRTYPDTVVTCRSNFDSHGFTIHPLFMAKAPDKASIDAYLPYRCMLPKELDGVLVTGLGMSAQRDSLPVIRMQPDVQNQGYVAGVAAATAAAEGAVPRAIDIKGLQRHLVAKGILRSDIPAHGDSFPLAAERIAAAAAGPLDSHLDLAILFAHPDSAVALLRNEYSKERERDRKLRIAHLLGLMGDDGGVQTLLEDALETKWDDGWRYRGMGQFGFSLSPVDSRLVALGRSGNAKAIPAMLAKLSALAPGAEFSHYRACVLAFEAQPSPEAAPHFEALLTDPSIRGQARQALPEALRDIPEDRCDNTERNRELSELVLARGLLACGDPNGVACQVLAAYANDLHGHYARHARAVLAAHKPCGVAV